MISKKNKSKNNGSDPLRGPPSTALRYNGPVQVATKGDKTEVFTFFNDFAGTATASSNSLASNPVYNTTLVTSSAQYSTVAGLYQEVRCLAIGVEFVPMFKNFGIYSTNGGSSPINSQAGLHIMAPYHADGTAFSNGITALYHAGRKIKSVNQPLAVTVRMSEADEAIFYSVAGGTFNSMGVKVWFSATTNGATDQLNWGTYVISHTMQFRGRCDGSTQFKKLGSDVKTKEMESIKEKKEDKKDVKEKPMRWADYPDDDYQVVVDRGRALSKPLSVTTKKTEAAPDQALKKKFIDPPDSAASWKG